MSNTKNNMELREEMRQDMLEEAWLDYDGKQYNNYNTPPLPGLEEYDGEGNPAEAAAKQVGGSHYQLPIQPIEYIIKNDIGYLEGNVIKYVTRHKTKNGLQDIEKAIHYLEFIKEQYVD